MGHCFPSIFDNSSKNKGQAFSVNFAQRLYNSCYHSHAPGQHIWPSPGSGLTLSAPKQCKWMFMSRVQILSQQDHHNDTTDDIGGNEKLKRAQEYKGTCVTALTNSVPHNMANGLQRGDGSGALHQKPG